jgi:glycosyltransferase involved in cell wall biosynthesis
MRLVAVIDSLGAGGAEVSLAEMLPGFADRGIEATVACFYRRTEGVQDAVIADGHDIRFIDDRSVFGRARALRKLVANEGADLIHTNLFEADIAGRLASIGLSVPVLTSLVNTTYTGARLADPNVNRVKLAAVRSIDSWTAKRFTDHFHAISHAVKDAAITALGIDPGRVSVVERGRDPLRLGAPSADRTAAARERLGLAADTPVLVTAGRQEYQKGQVHLLRAMAELRRRVPGVVLLLAGREGHASNELRVVHGNLGLSGSVRFLGHRDDLPDVLAAADLFVFPSLYEGAGGAVIEAMALGLPVIASDIPALAEVLEPGENAILVLPANPTALAGSIEELLGDPDRMARYAARSRSRFEERYTLDRAVDGMVSLYEGVVAGR